MNRRRARSLTAVALVLMVGLPAAWTFRVVRQERLDRALIAAVKARHVDEAVRLLDAGASPNARDLPLDARPLWQRLRDLFRPDHTSPEGLPALIHALQYNFSASDTFSENRIACALIRRGANVQIKGEYGNAPLHYAVASNDMAETVRLLFHSGPDLTTVNDRQETPIHCSINSPACTLLLLEAGADPNRVAYDKVTPLHQAVWTGNTGVISLLLQYGADPTCHDIDGRSPYDIALMRQRRIKDAQFARNVQIIREAVRRRKGP